MTDRLHCPDCGIPTIADANGLTDDDVRCNACTDRRERQYVVTWQIDVWADSPEAAAREALRIQRDTQSIATVFDVADGAETVRIDLTEIDETNSATG